MIRLGSFGGPYSRIDGDFSNLNGSIRVLKERCHSCPYTPNSTFNPQLKRIHKECQESRIFNYCHNTYPSDVPDAMCRGSYDAFISRFIGTPDFIDEPKSSYIVSPLPI